MRKNLLFAFILLIGVSNLFAQTLVSKNPVNKKVILEEYTGIHCTYCPDGHRLANLLAESNPEDVFLINIHQGNYAIPNSEEPDFRTEWGDAIAGQAGIAGYPAGTINRHFFPDMQQGFGTAISRFDFETATEMQLEEISYVNLGVEAILDLSVSPALLTVHVEAYYTGNDAPSNNKLNIALLQDSILGPQVGMAVNPEYVLGDQYIHMHALRHLLTGQWGNDITTTTQGTFIDKTYTWEIPSNINDIILKPNHLKVLAFITETEQEIISGHQCDVEIIPPINSIDCEILNLSNLPVILCGEGLVSPIINVLNKVGNPITSMEITYDANNGIPMVYDWTGNIVYYANKEITLPELTFPIETINNINIVVTKVNGDMDQDESNNSVSKVILEASEVINVTLDLKTDNYGTETTWQVEDDAGTVIYFGGPYSNSNNLVEDQSIFELPVTGCYTFKIFDSHGDGINSSNGFYKLYSKGELFHEGGSFTSIDIVPFNNKAYDGLEDYNILGDFNIYPNPSTGLININNAEGAQISIHNIVGQQVLDIYTASTNQQIDLSKLDNGAYMIRIQMNKYVKTKMIILNK